VNSTVLLTILPKGKKPGEWFLHDFVSSWLHLGVDVGFHIIFPLVYEYSFYFVIHHVIRWLWLVVRTSWVISCSCGEPRSYHDDRGGDCNTLALLPRGEFHTVYCICTHIFFFHEPFHLDVTLGIFNVLGKSNIPGTQRLSSRRGKEVVDIRLCTFEIVV